MTVVQAIEAAMHAAGTPLSAKEAYDLIVARSLYAFRAKAPQQIVAQQLRRHCKGIQSTNSSPTKRFQRAGADKYSLLAAPVTEATSPRPATRRQAP